MRQVMISVLVLLGLASPAAAQSVTLPAEIKGSPGAWVIVAPEKTEGGKPRWRIDPGLQEVRLDLLLPPETLAQLRGKVVTAAVPGRYRVESWNAKGDVASEIATCWVVIGDPGPPTPPTPPKPPVPPIPPIPPIPPPDVAPIPAPGFRALFIYETAELAKLPPGQIAALYAKDIYDYLNAKCVKGLDGKTAEARWWDKDVNTSNEAPHWQAAMKRERKSLPWLIISDGTKGYEGPLPLTAEDTISLLKKFGG